MRHQRFSKLTNFAFSREDDAVTLPRRRPRWPPAGAGIENENKPHYTAWRTARTRIFKRAKVMLCALGIWKALGQGEAGCYQRW